MTEQEAKDRCKELAAEHPDRDTHSWIAVPQGDGEWGVAKLNVPPAPRASGSETRKAPLDATDPKQGGIL